MATHHPIRKEVAPVIPDKLYFRIGDVAKLCDVPAYVLRFWETEFPQLKPNKGGTGQRLYRRRDVETALRIKTLLYDDGYTIPGARQALKGEKVDAKAKIEATEPVRDAPFMLQPSNPVTTPAAANEKQMRALRAEMQSLLEMLSMPAVATVDMPKPRAKVQTMRPRQAPAENDGPQQLSMERDLF